MNIQSNYSGMKLIALVALAMSFCAVIAVNSASLKSIPSHEAAPK
jgi:hypothetical protein